MLGPMLLADVVATSEAVTATSRRTAKVAALADLLRRLSPAEVEPAVGFLVGWPRQGKIGIGWATLAAVTAPPADEPTLSVLEVDDVLDELVAIAGSGSTAARQQRLHAMLSRATAPEQSFLHRLLLGELRQGANEGVMADAVAAAASVPAAVLRRAAMFAGDLGVAARVGLTEGAAGLQAIGLTVLQPVQPMLASPAPTLADALAETGPASVEWKLDGARIQAHRRGDDVRLFTRNLNDVTGRLAPVAAAIRTLPTEDLVLDGEVIGLDEEELADGARPRRFQDTMSTFGRDDAGPGGGLRAFFFDVLHADGESLVDRPLVDRLTVLDAVAGPVRIPHLVTADASEAAAFFDRALASGHEGVVVKALTAPYDAGRRGGAWRKVKPVRTVDLVVLAAEWGHGRRRGWLSNLHLGAREPSDNSFVMVGKTFKGMTDQLLAWQTERLQQLAIGTEGITVHVRPELVVEIALDGVQVSRRYPGGVALRFARVKRYREDKAAAEADTIDAVRALLV
jgi:DNA ligase-1